MNLIEQLSQIKDFRRKQGQRFLLWQVLLIIIMAIMSGRYGYREIASFAKANSNDLISKLKLKHAKIPSHVTIREVIMNIDFDLLNQAFNQWSLGYVTLDKEDWLSIDGKSIKSTVENYNSAYQNFVSMVSIFSQKRGQVIKTATFENKKISEIPVVQMLLETLDLKDVVFTMDALHCKKNATSDRCPGKPIRSKSKGQPA
jgi:DDE_Tnp_1-associated